MVMPVKKPVAWTDYATMDADHSILLDVLANDRDRDGDSNPLILASVNPAGAVGAVGIVGQDDNRQLNYDPNGQFAHLGSGQIGYERLEYTATDSNGATTTGVVRVKVLGVNDAPVADQGIEDQTAEGGSRFRFRVPEDAFADIDNGDRLTFSATLADGSPLPSWLRLNPNTGTFSGTPTGGQAESLQLLVSATDKAGASATTTFDLSIIHDSPPPPEGGGNLPGGESPPEGENPPSEGGELWVGPNETYKRLADAVAASRDGDTIYIRAGVYENDFAIIKHDLSIISVGGKAHLKSTIKAPNGKAILVTDGDIVIDGLEFSGAQVWDRNGAGIRHQSGDLTVRNSSFHDNEMGILAIPNPEGEIYIENTEFASNGRLHVDWGWGHSLYVNMAKSLTVVNSEFRDAQYGHHLKSRALETTVENSRFEDGPDGRSSYAIDLPEGGKGVIRGNVFIEGPDTENPAIISYGAEAPKRGLHDENSLLVQDNSFSTANDNTVGIRNHSNIEVVLDGNDFGNVTTPVKGGTYVEAASSDFESVAVLSLPANDGDADSVSLSLDDSSAPALTSLQTETSEPSYAPPYDLFTKDNFIHADAGDQNLRDLTSAWMYQTENDGLAQKLGWSAIDANDIDLWA